MTSSNNIDTELDRLSEYNKLSGRGHGDLEDHCYICGISPKGIKQTLVADRNKLIKHLAFQLGEDEEHLRKLVEMMK